VTTLTFQEYCRQYGQLKKEGKLQEAKRFLEKYRKQVQKEMAAKDAASPEAPSRFDREDVI
jgi:hypothetical protein